MIMKTVQRGSNKIDHVEYGDNVMYFYSSKNRHGNTITEVISRRIISRIMKHHTDDEYNVLLETVIKSAREALTGRSSTQSKNRSSCRSCPNNGACKGLRSCVE